MNSMPRQIEGSRAVADAVAMCRPEVICAYPITPQTHAYTATASRGLLYMSEAVYNAAGGAGPEHGRVPEYLTGAGHGGQVTKAPARMPDY